MLYPCLSIQVSDQQQWTSCGRLASNANEQSGHQTVQVEFIMSTPHCRGLTERQMKVVPCLIKSLRWHISQNCQSEVGNR